GFHIKASIDCSQFGKQIDIGQIRFVISRRCARGNENACPKMLGRSVVSPGAFFDDAQHDTWGSMKALEVGLGGKHDLRAMGDRDGVPDAQIPEPLSKQQFEFLGRRGTDSPEESKSTREAKFAEYVFRLYESA